MNNDWIKEFPGAVTICDIDGKIIYMNDKSASVFKEDGGLQLIGGNLFDCHSDVSNRIIRELISHKKINVYTIEKNGTKKMIYQSPWFENGEMKGLVELSFEIPFEMPHHKR